MGAVSQEGFCYSGLFNSGFGSICEVRIELDRKYPPLSTQPGEAEVALSMGNVLNERGVSPGEAH